MNGLVRWCAMVLALTVGAANAAPVLLTDGAGKLTGANGVMVDGVSYDVRFLDGTCIAVFSGCDDASDFLFRTSSSALAASEALLSQVFVDGVDGSFDNSPSLIAGCTRVDVCIAFTPYAPVVLPAPGFVLPSYRLRAAVNSFDEPFDFASSDSGEAIDLDTSIGFSGAFRVLAVWSPTRPFAVPAGSPLVLLAAGVIALGATRGRRPRISRT